MPRRRELKSLARGFAESTVSRNNDIGGYWGLGILYRAALEANTEEVHISILSDEVISKRLALFRKSFREKFLTGKPLGHFMREVIVVLHFEPYSTCRDRGSLSRVTCTIHITDDLNALRTATASTYCYSHDPRFESQSARVTTWPGW